MPGELLPVQGAVSDRIDHIAVGFDAACPMPTAMIRKASGRIDTQWNWALAHSPTSSTKRTTAWRSSGSVSKISS